MLICQHFFHNLFACSFILICSFDINIDSAIFTFLHVFSVYDELTMALNAAKRGEITSSIDTCDNDSSEHMADAEQKLKNFRKASKTVEGCPALTGITNTPVLFNQHSHPLNKVTLFLFYLEYLKKLAMHHYIICSPNRLLRLKLWWNFTNICFCNN